MSKRQTTTAERRARKRSADRPTKPSTARNRPMNVSVSPKSLEAADRLVDLQQSEHCRVLALAIEADTILRALDAIGDDPEARHHGTTTALHDRLETIKDEASYLAPRSADGATFQMIVANAEIDVLFSSRFSTEDEREQVERRSRRLLEHGIYFLMPSCKAAARWAKAGDYFLSEFALQRTLLKKGLAQGAAEVGTAASPS